MRKLVCFLRTKAWKPIVVVNKNTIMNLIMSFSNVMHITLSLVYQLPPSVSDSFLEVMVTKWNTPRNFDYHLTRLFTCKCKSTVLLTKDNCTTVNTNFNPPWTKTLVFELKLCLRSTWPSAFSKRKTACVYKQERTDLLLVWECEFWD